MDKYQISFPKILDSTKIMNYNLFVSEIIENNPEEICVNLSKIEFVTPSGLCPLISFIKILKVKFPYKKYCITPPVDNSVRNYLSRIGLFEHLNIKKFKVNKKPCKESLMELTQISYGDSSFERDSNIMNLIKKNIKCTDTTVNRIGYAVGEMVQNIIDHSESPVGGFMCAQVYRNKKTLEVCFSDYGVGIATKIKNKFDYDKSDAECILEATELSVSTGSLDKNSGQGLFLTKKIIQDNKGSMKIVSNNGIIKINKNGHVIENCKFNFPGTTISLKFNLEKPIRDDIFDIKELDSQYYDNDIWDNILES